VKEEISYEVLLKIVGTQLFISLLENKLLSSTGNVIMIILMNQPSGCRRKTAPTFCLPRNLLLYFELVKTEILVFHTSILCVWVVVGRKSFDLFERDKCDRDE
jgi:hypothetical protein